MSLYAMNESTERATLNFFLGTAQARARRAEACEEPVETWEDIMAAIPQHPAAQLGSAVDDCWVAALNKHDEGR